MVKITRKLWVALVVSASITCAAGVKHWQQPSVSPEEIAAFNPFPISSPARHEQDEFLNWQMNNHQLADAALTPGLADRQKAASRLMVQGMAKLHNDLLAQYLPLVSKVLGALDEDSCAKFVKGKLPPTEFRVRANKIVGSFNAEEARTWFLVEKSAIQSDLDGVPNVSASLQGTATNIIKLAASLPNGEGDSFLLRLRAFPTANYAEACSIARSLYSQGSKMDEPDRGRVARSLLTTHPH
jgi:hypothetical protein